MRSATHDDLPRLVELTTAFYAEDGFMATEQALAERFGSLLRRPDANVTVAAEATSGVVIGFALTTIRLILESGPVAELQDLYVEPRFRGRGVGSALIADAAAWSRANSASMLEVVIAPNGRDVSHLERYYEARGFVDRGRRIVHLDI